MASGSISESTIDVAGIRTFVRRSTGTGSPTVLVHGNPTHSGDWVPFLERIEGPAVAFDLPCFGRSERPPPDRFDASMDAYAGFVGAALDVLAVDRYKLVVHDWGGIALAAAQRDPARLERLVVINAVPLLAGYRWHWVARIWRRRGLGEALNRITTRRTMTLLLRLARPRLRPMPRQFIEMAWPHYDRGTRDAVLRLYRSADPERLAAAGAALAELRCPALVVWGIADPYIGVEMGRAYARALPEAELLTLPDAGHWPWIDRPELVGRIAEFLAA